MLTMRYDSGVLCAIDYYTGLFDDRGIRVRVESEHGAVVIRVDDDAEKMPTLRLSLSVALAADLLRALRGPGSMLSTNGEAEEAARCAGSGGNHHERAEDVGKESE